MVDSSTGGYLPPIGTLPLSGDAFADAIQAWVAGITGLSGSLVRPRWQPTPPNQPSLTTDWCAIGVISETAEAGYPAFVHDPAANGGLGRSTSYRHLDVDVLASFYGPNAHRYSTVFAAGAFVGQNNEALKVSGIAFVSIDDIRAAHEQFQTQWVYRYDVPVKLRRVVSVTYDIQNITSAAVHLLTDDGEISHSIAAGS